jgi:hypothetical protein
MEFAPRMCQAAGFPDAELEEYFIAAIVVAEQGASPLPKELTGMAAGAGFGRISIGSTASQTALTRITAVAPAATVHIHSRPRQARSH